jgi:hypothetical protein
VADLEDRAVFRTLEQLEQRILMAAVIEVQPFQNRGVVPMPFLVRLGVAANVHVRTSGALLTVTAMANFGSSASNARSSGRWRRLLRESESGGRLAALGEARDFWDGLPPASRES